MKKKLLAILFISITLGSVASCKEQKEENAEPEKPLVFQARITFLQGSIFVDNKKANRFTRILEGSVVKTGKQSIAIIQFGNGALITVKSNTSFKVSRLDKDKNGKGLVELKQSKGYSFSKINKGKVNYKLYSTTSVAAVRGTSFSFEVGKKGKTSIKLLKGIIKASPVVAGKVIEKKTINIKKGQKIVAVKKGLGKIKAMAQKEKKSLKKLNTINFVEMKKIVQATRKAKKTTSALEQEANNPEAEIANIIIPGLAPSKIIKFGAKKVLIPGLKEKKKKKLTLEQIGKKYGKISQIHTKSGKVYTGYFKQKGSYAEIITVNGKVKINTSDIKKFSSPNK